MPPLNCIEISDDDDDGGGGKKRVVKADPEADPEAASNAIRALAIVSKLNSHIEDANSAIKLHKDEIARLRELLKAAEERLEKDQKRRLKLIEDKSRALDSVFLGGNEPSVEKPIKTEARNKSPLVPAAGSRGRTIKTELRDKTPSVPAVRSRKRIRHERDVSYSTVKSDPDSSDDNELYSARDPSVEMWEKSPEPWVMPTEDNDKIAASDDPFRKFDAKELIRIWEPFVIPDMPKFPTTKFSRRFLSKYLGGCEQAQECIISEAKKRTQIYKINVYYCERAEWAPDMPAKPGTHGAVYATRREDRAVDFNYSTYPVFCRRGANEWEYCGNYEITRRDFVSGEWSRVSPIAKKSWSEGYAGKRGKWGIVRMQELGIITPGQKVTSEDVLQFIDDGLLRLECQVYKCVGFDWKFYDVLEAKWHETINSVKSEVLDED